MSMIFFLVTSPNICMKGWQAVRRRKNSTPLLQSVGRPSFLPETALTYSREHPRLRQLETLKKTSWCAATVKDVRLLMKPGSIHQNDLGALPLRGAVRGGPSETIHLRRVTKKNRQILLLINAGVLPKNIAHLKGIAHIDRLKGTTHLKGITHPKGTVHIAHPKGTAHLKGTTHIAHLKSIPHLAHLNDVTPLIRNLHHPLPKPKRVLLAYGRYSLVQALRRINPVPREARRNHHADQKKRNRELRRRKTGNTHLHHLLAVEMTLTLHNTGNIQHQWYV